MTFAPSAVAAVVVVMLALACGAVVVAVRPSTAASRPTDRRGLIIAAVVFVLVLMATRWLVLAAVAAGLVHAWPTLVGDRSIESRARLDGIAKWLEDLRDTLRSSTIVADEALEQVARRPPDPIAPALGRFALRRRQGFSTDEALEELGAELDHPTSDAAVAALRMVVGGTAGAARLQRTVGALAASARDEVRARERIDRTRAVYRSSMKRLIVVGAVLVGYLRWMAGDLLAPYDTPAGQVALLVPVAMWTGCVLWLRRLCQAGGR